MANDLSMYRGDTKAIALHFTNADGSDKDITDWTVFFTLKKSELDTDAEAKIVKNVTEHTVPLEGKTQFTIEPADTLHLVPGKYVYDVQTKNGDTISTLVKGVLTIIGDVTRRVSV